MKLVSYRVPGHSYHGYELSSDVLLCIDIQGPNAHEDFPAQRQFVKYRVVSTAYNGDGIFNLILFQVFILTNINIILSQKKLTACFLYITYCIIH